MSTVSTEQFWSALHGELLGYVRARVHDRSAAEDLVQSTFLQAHRHLSQGVQPLQPRAWLFQILKHLIIDTHRYSQRQRSLNDRLRAEGVNEGWWLEEGCGAGRIEDASHGAEGIDWQPDTATLIAKALPMFIAQLPPSDREALQWVEIEGLSQVEAAHRAGLSVSGMKSRVQRARRKLAELLERCCAFERDGRGRVITCTPRSSDCC